MSRQFLEKRPQGRSQRGYSLIELMIASVIGLLLLGGIVQIFISSRATYSSVAAQSEISENGRVSMIMIGGALRHAGYWDEIQQVKNFAAGAGFEVQATITGTDNDASEALVTDGTDTVAVRFSGAADGAMSVCDGTPAISQNQAAVERLYIRPAQAGSDERVSTLMCDVIIYKLDTSTGAMTDAGPPARVELINGIENMQVLYGVQDGPVYRNLRADQVTDWTNIDSVSVALLASTGNTVVGVAREADYTLLDQTVAPSADGKPRQVITQTIQLRNGQFQ